MLLCDVGANALQLLSSAVSLSCPKILAYLYSLIFVLLRFQNENNFFTSGVFGMLEPRHRALAFMHL